MKRFGKLTVVVVYVAALVFGSVWSMAQTGTGTTNVTTSTGDSQPTAAVIRDSQGILALQQSLAALGGGLPSSVTASGSYATYKSNGSSVAVPIWLEALGTSKFRRAVDLPDGTHTSIVRGRSGWQISPTDTQGLSIAQLAGIRYEDLPVLAIAEWLNNQAVQIIFVGAETLNDTSVLHIAVRPNAPPSDDSRLKQAYEETSRCEIYLSSQTNLPVRVRYYAPTTDWRRSTPTDLDFGDFRSVSGVMFPFTITRYVSRHRVSTTQWESIILNVPLTDVDFVAEVAQ
jgi:hypothetical protein